MMIFQLLRLQAQKSGSCLRSHVCFRPPFSWVRFRSAESLDARGRKMGKTVDTEKPTMASDILAPYVPYIFIEDVERLHYYRPGGYHPVTLGDVLHDRYRVVDKLGFGTYSTTWLAKDEISTTWVALKICIANIATPSESDLSRLLSNIDVLRKRHPGADAMPPVLDSFTIRGPNGLHYCIVTNPARLSVAASREASFKRVFQPDVARSIAAQLAQAVAFLHSQDIVHAGEFKYLVTKRPPTHSIDLHEGNILLRLPDPISGLTAEQLHAKYREPILESIERADGQPLDANVPTQAVLPIWWGEDCDLITLAESRIYLTDFGESFQPATTIRHHSNTPYSLRPPEIYFDPIIPLSFPSDIWSLACTIFFIQGQRPLFENIFAREQTMITEYIESLGPLPKEWWERWPERWSVFDENLNRKDGERCWSFEDRLELSIQEPRRELGLPEMDEDEKGAFIALMKSMLAYKPDDRPSAEQVLQSEWMRKWALKDLERARQLFSIPE